ncbi:MAG: GIDE domain-containing protein [Desulfuromonas thiophila]|nr:GIDE domain-containing protein [Desulfuromonas thiophila]
MAVNADDSRLYVQAQPTTPQLSALCRQLAAAGGPDAYSCGQRLKGLGIAELARGPRNILAALTPLLADAGWACWLLPAPSAPVCPPRPLQTFEQRDESLWFYCDADRFELTPDDPAPLLILADLSGQAVAAHLRRQLARHSYGQGAENAAASLQRLEKDIFQHQPRLDLYWRDASGTLLRAVRIRPGSFDHRQLGDQASLSRNANLLALLQRIRQCCPAASLHQTLGLAFLPDYPLHLPATTEAEQQRNALALTGYGQLMATIEQANAFQSAVEQPAALAGAEHGILLAAGATLPSPLGDTAATAPSETAANPPTPDSAPAPLPPPPEGAALAGRRWPLAPAQLAVFAIASLTALLTQLQPHWLRPLLGGLLHSGLLAAGAALLCLISAFRALHLKHCIAHTPTSRIRSLAMGRVEIQGQARRLYALVSPLTQLPCVYYSLKRYRRNARDNGWDLVSSRSSGAVPFALEDATGSIRIDPAGARLRPSQTQEIFGNSHLPLATGLANNEKWREEIIADGAPLYVLGYAHSRRQHADQQGLLRQRLRDLKQDSAKLRDYDRNGDGRIDSQEWDEARQAQQRQLLLEQLRPDREAEAETWVGRPPGRWQPFLIAEQLSETELGRGYGLSFVLLLLVGVALAVWALLLAGSYFALWPGR